MRVLSFDVGMKNLAYCIIDNNDIKYWDVIQIPIGYNESMCINLVKELDKYEHMLDIDQVVIEKQPAKNNKMRIMEHLLTSYFVIKGVNSQESPIKKVKVYSAKFKLGSSTFKGKQNYSARKKLAVTRCAEYLKETTQTDEINTKFEKSKKKDDLADSLLQALSFITCPIFEKIQHMDLDSVCLISARKPTKVQEKKGYTKANLKWLFLNESFIDKSELIQFIDVNEKVKKAMTFWYPKQGIDQALRECKMFI
jgi:hypothetical protein